MKNNGNKNGDYVCPECGKNVDFKVVQRKLMFNGTLQPIDVFVGECDCQEIVLVDLSYDGEIIKIGEGYGKAI